MPQSIGSIITKAIVPFDTMAKSAAIIQVKKVNNLGLSLNFSTNFAAVVISVVFCIPFPITNIAANKITDVLVIFPNAL